MHVGCHDYLNPEMFLGKSFLVEWATNSWNRLPEHVADVSTLNCFNARVDKLWSEYRYSQHLSHDYYSYDRHYGERPDLQHSIAYQAEEGK